MNGTAETPPEGPAGDPRVELHGESHDSSMFVQIGTQVIRIGTQIVQPLPPSGLEVRYSLPPDTAAFTGRDDEMRLITTAVTEAASVGRVVAIHAIGGIPGVGKTALAVHVAHLLRDRFPERQLFINLHAHTPGQDPVSPEAALAELLTAAGVDPRYLPEGLESRTALWRDRMANQRALLVLDNVASSAQITRLLPGSKSCLVLVTSRRHLGDLPGVVVPVTLGALSPQEAQTMFLRLVPRAADGLDTAVAELVQLAGYLPLAISLLARVYARHPSWAMDDLIRETRASLLNLAAENDSVAAAFDVSYRYLSQDQQRLFRRLGMHPGLTIDSYAAANLADVSLREAASRLDALHGEGLLLEISYRRYAMHDLIRRYAQDLTKVDRVGERDQALEHLLNYFQYSAAIAETRLARQSRTTPGMMTITSPPTVLPVISDRTQALTWARAERDNLLKCLDHVEHANQHARVVALTATMVTLLRQDGPWDDAIVRHSVAIQAARHIGDRLAEANALNDLGLIRYLTGDYGDAAKTLTQALSIFRGIGDRLGEANVLNDMGAVRQQTGDYQGATEVQREALSIFRDIADLLGQAYALTYLGAGLRLANDYEGAAATLEEALTIFRNIGDRPGEANALNHLGVVGRMTGNYQGAAEALKGALSIFRGLGNRQGQANALNYLGVVQRLIGDNQEAAETLEEALEIDRDIGDRLGQANALNFLGVVRQLTADLQGAADALDEALEIYRDIGDRGGEVEALNWVGALHLVRNDLDHSEEFHRQALELARAIDSSWDEAHALAGLARCALAAGRAADAEAGLRQAYEIFQRIGAAEAIAVTSELNALTDERPTPEER
jgi:tetratricopeptide (TPR) repeat protein